MAAESLSPGLLGMEALDLARLARAARRLLLGSPTRPFGSRPRASRGGDGLEFLDHRAYGLGDDPRRIDWRASARSPQLVVRRQRDEALASIVLCLDCSASMRVLPAKWVLARQICAGLAWIALCLGNRLAFLAFDDRIAAHTPPLRSLRDFERLAKLLRRLPEDGGGGSRLDLCLPAVGARDTAIVVSDFLAPDGLRSGLEPLLAAAHRIQAIQLLGESDVLIETPGTAVLRDSETGERRRLALTGSLREAARQRVTAHREALAAFCRRQGVALTQCDGASRWSDVLAAHLRGLGSQLA
jgi:uncharacterized protein (DUF58 family)